MKIGIIGAGNVGTALGGGWIRTGHDVLFGARRVTAEKERQVREAAGASARVASVTEAAAHGEAVALCTPWEAARDALGRAGDLTGKIVLDCTNPLAGWPPQLAVGFSTSGGEQVASWAPGARVVKIFNTTGSSNMVEPRYPEGAAVMFHCGDDAEAKAVASRLAADLGFDPVDAGPLSAARLLEPMAMLWIQLAYSRRLGREIAFRLMRR